MANSSYYRNLYRKKRSEVKSYDRELNSLKAVRYNLTETMCDEINLINNELEELKSNLKHGIRHALMFNSNADAIIAKKEKDVTADPNLRIAVSEIEEEIYRINGLKLSAEDDRDYYYRVYKNKKEEEYREFLDKIF